MLRQQEEIVVKAMRIECFKGSEKSVIKESAIWAVLRQ